jgi:protein-disulfide isomerase
LRRLLPVPKDPITSAGAPELGDRGAPAVVIIFSDFQCPYCGEFARTEFHDVVDEYVRDGRLRVVFEYFPLTTIHPQALQAAHAAECADEQGQFWKLHDLLFRNQDRLDQQHLDEMVQGIGTDMQDFRRCLSADAAAVHRGMLLAQSLKINSTPTFVFGVRSMPGSMVARRIVVGTMTTPQLRAEIDSLLHG